MKKILIFLAALLICCTQLPCFGADVSMAFGEKIPPFCFPETNSGIEVEVVSEALAYRGHHLIPKYFPFARIPLEFKTKHVDAAMTDLGMDLTPFGGYYANPGILYDNVFISLKERNLVISKPEDLKGLTVISFQGAENRYPDWLGPVKKDGRYFEQNNQELQVLTLDKGRYDLVLSDRNIFKYFTLKLKKEKGFVPKDTEEHSFVKLNPMDYRAVFREKGIRDDFNAGLAHLKETGRFQKIYDKYLKE